jgi:hypothetical protein
MSDGNLRRRRQVFLRPAQIGQLMRRGGQRHVEDQGAQVGRFGLLGLALQLQNMAECKCVSATPEP